jgi:hypothetical protein
LHGVGVSSCPRRWFAAGPRCSSRVTHLHELPRQGPPSPNHAPESPAPHPNWPPPTLLPPRTTPRLPPPRRRASPLPDASPTPLHPTKHHDAMPLPLPLPPNVRDPPALRPPHHSIRQKRAQSTQPTHSSLQNAHSNRGQPTPTHANTNRRALIHLLPPSTPSADGHPLPFTPPLRYIAIELPDPTFGSFPNTPPLSILPPFSPFPIFPPFPSLPDLPEPRRRCAVAEHHRLSAAGREKG